MSVILRNRDYLLPALIFVTIVVILFLLVRTIMAQQSTVLSIQAVYCREFLESQPPTPISKLPPSTRKGHGSGLGLLISQHSRMN